MYREIVTDELRSVSLTDTKNLLFEPYFRISGPDASDEGDYSDDSLSNYVVMIIENRAHPGAADYERYLKFDMSREDFEAVRDVINQFAECTANTSY